jgi:hypothetical protein
MNRVLHKTCETYLQDDIAGFKLLKAYEMKINKMGGHALNPNQYHPHQRRQQRQENKQSINQNVVFVTKKDITQRRVKKRLRSPTNTLVP